MPPKVIEVPIPGIDDWKFDKQIEQAAKAMYECRYHAIEWAALDDETHFAFRTMARAAAKVFNGGDGDIPLAERLRKALELACQDAWPDNPHWPDLYTKRAAGWITAERAAKAKLSGETPGVER